MGVIALYGSFPAVVSEFLVSCNTKDKSLQAKFFSMEEFGLLTQLIDIVLPRTATPGGLDTNTPYFIDLVVKECLSAENQQLIKKGLDGLNTINGKMFPSLSAEEKKKFVMNLDENAFKEDNTGSWYRILKKLALVGHFTSQEGMKTALKYVQVPGDYQASVPYKKGDKAMAKTFLMYW